jgi:hypothetical protein
MSSSRSVLLLVSLCLFSNLADAQYLENIHTARPGASFGAYTTGARVFQVQTGFTYDWKSQKDSENTGNGIGYLLTFRYGVTETFEARASFGARRDNVVVDGVEDDFGGLDLINLGFRWNVIDGKDSGPALSFQQDFRLNAGTSEVYRLSNLAPRTLLLYSMPLTSWLGLTTNLGLVWDGENPGPFGYYTFNLGFPVANKVSGFVELFGNINDNRFGASFDTGVGYLVNNDLQLDLSVGFVSLFENTATAYFVDGGVSWRFRHD